MTDARKELHRPVTIRAARTQMTPAWRGHDGCFVRRHGV